MPEMALDLEKYQLIAKTIRFLAADAVQKANSGHPGMPMGCADLATALWARHLRFDPDDPEWTGRDRFVLSAGHGSLLLYSLLHLFGFKLTLDDIKSFRQLGSKTPGHPERGHTPGVEVTTGPLSQGLSNAVGMALGAKMASGLFADREFDPFSAKIYVLVGDGCLMEGVGYEACSLAGHLKLDNLIVLYDNNHVTIDGSTEISFSEDVRKRFEAMHWSVQHADGHDIAAVDTAVERAKREDKPSLIICDTHIALGSPTKQDSPDAHGSPLGAEEIAKMRETWNWPREAFHIPEEVRDYCGKVAQAKREIRSEWERKLQGWLRSDGWRAQRFSDFASRRLPEDLLSDLLAKAPRKADATRSHGGAVLQEICRRIPWVIGGSADLAGSNKTAIKDGGVVEAGGYNGRNIHFGVREHAMGAISSGLAAFGGWRPFASTFLVFADYMRPAIRMAALMKLPVLFIFTHDSYLVGEDGPTHQPIEHIESLRAIPNLQVVRPADGVETAAAYFSALHYDGPTAVILSRQKLPAIERESEFNASDLLAGAQVLTSGMDEVAIIAATGSEVSAALEAAKILKAEGIRLRVVSILSREKFLARTEDERASIIPYGRPVCSIEAGSTGGWAVLTGRRGLRIGLDHFGASAPDEALRVEYGFTPEQVAGKIKRWLKGLAALGRLDVTIRD